MTATTMENDPVVIVGLACRFPGGNNNPSKVWEFLAQAKSGQGDIPAQRFNIDGFYNPDKSAPASIHTRGGYFLQEDIREFENDFFGINNMEATHLDPSQRKLLEVVYECFENAGIPMKSVSGANVGCYVGNFLPDFAVVQDKDPELFSRFSATAKGVTILSNRISHAFNLKGPSMVIDTACSASIYGLHLACQAILDGSCDGAVVAGVNLIQSMEEHIATAKAGILSPSGTCRTFDISANGYGRGEAVNALYLKRLSDAVRDNDPIRAVIRGSAINSNGRTAGISLPSIDGQEAAIRAAYKQAKLDPLETAYVECHGTGTAVGDPIEVEALARVFAPGRDAAKPLLIGSVKTNFGHGEAASGVTSLIKNILAMEKDEIPATVGIEVLNPKIKTDEWKVKVVTEQTKWPITSGIQRVSVNSFGYGGANAHVIIESVKSYYGTQSTINQVQPAEKGRVSYLFPFTANARSSLHSYMPKLAAVASNYPVQDLAYTYGSRRSVHRTKGFLVANQENISTQLAPENLKVTEKDTTPYDLAFVFTGQGAQWPTMGKELFDEFPLFRSTLEDLDAALQLLPEAPSWSIRDAILEPAETSKIHRPAFSQALCAALQIGLVTLLRSWGIRPRAIVGHSSGEIAAAFAAGILTARQAVIAAYLRGLAVEEISMDGAMLAVSMSVDEANETLAEHNLEGKVRIGCINSPSSITLSGNADGIEAILNTLKAQKKFGRKLVTGGKAYHSHHMAAVSGRYETQLDAALGEVLPPQDGIRFVSSVYNREVKEGLGAHYWRSNADSAVLFSPAVTQLLEGRTYHLVEIGPHAALKMPISQIAAEVPNSAGTWRYSSAILRGKNCAESLLSMVGELYLAGHPIDFAKVNNATSETKTLVDLPAYSWYYHGTNFIESRSNEEYRNRLFARHELLGSQIPGMSGLDMTWRNMLRVKDVPWLADHKLDETVVFPGAGYCVMAIEAMRQIHGTPDTPTPATRLRHVSIQTALTLPADQKEAVEVFTRISPQRLTARMTSDTWYHFEISSFSNGRATIHVTGHICHDSATPEPLSEAHLSENAYTAISPTLFYQHLSQEGLVFGPNFRSLVRVQAARDAAPYSVGHTHYVPTKNAHLGSVFSYPIHPITLDAMLQASMAAGLDGKVASLRGKIPVTIGEIHVVPCPVMEESDKFRIHTACRPSDFGYTTMSADLMSPVDSQILARVNDVRLTPFNGGNQIAGEMVREPILRITWRPDIGAELTRKHTRKSAWSNLFSMSAVEKEQTVDVFDLNSMLKSLCFKNPQMRVLEIFAKEHGISASYPKSILSKQWADYSFGNLTTGYLSAEGKVYRNPPTASGQTTPASDAGNGPMEGEATIAEEAYDLVIINSPQELATETLMLISDGFVSNNGLILAPDALQMYEQLGLHMIAKAETDVANHSFTLGTKSTNGSKFERSAKMSTPINIIKIDSDSDNGDFAKQLAQKLQKEGAKTNVLSYEQLDTESLPAESIAICLLELHQPMLSKITEDQMSRVKELINGCSKMLWVSTNGLPSQTPEMSIIKGLSRSVMLEHPALQFFTLDVNSSELDAERLASSALYIFQQPGNPLLQDFEFADVSGSLHISRFLPDRLLNQTFRERQGLDTAMKSISHNGLYKLMLTKQGRIDSAVFQEQPSMDDLTPQGFVDIHVKAIGLNSSDFSVLHGKKTTVSGTASSQLAGVVTSTGFDVDDVQIGDRVLVLAPTPFQTTVRVPAWSCHKLLQHESFETMSALPVRFSTALYALRERANLRQGETVLIHCGTSGVGDAAIQLAKRIGAKVFTTVSSEEHADYVHKTHGIPRKNIFSCQDTNFASSLLKMTDNHGADVILSSLTGEHLHESWRVCADFGRFIDIGRQDLAENGFLSMMPFSKSASYTALCMHCLHVRGADQADHVTSRLLRDVLSMFRAGYITVPESYHHVFGVDQLTEAFRYFASKDRTGTVSLSFDGHKMTTKVAPFSYAAKFRSEKTYFLVGCLGGLGRSISNWMFDRGARKFLFMGRSGLDRAPAQELVAHLEGKGAIVNVVKGDVTSQEDVTRAVNGIRGQVGGIINAAMGLSEAVFMDMSATAWRKGIDPKCVGTWNIHNALQQRENELDFFLLMSSLNGSIGSATESNYCAANSFLDAFAAYRQSRGLVCTAVGFGAIAEVGYVHDNAHAQTHMQRRGIRSLTESELLQVVDIALSSNRLSRGVRKTDRAVNEYKTSEGLTSSSHILTGLEPFDPMTLLQLGIKQKNPVDHDPRAIHLARRFEEVMQKSGSSSGSSSADNDLEQLCEKGAPVESILPIAAKGLAELILQPIDLLDTGKSLAAYGMDSMLASEYRSWFFKTFRVDVPFMDLLSASSTVTTLAKIVSDKLKLTLAASGRAV